MSAKDRLAEKLRSMKKEKFSNKERTENNGMKKPRSKPRDERSQTQVSGGGDSKGAGGSVTYRGKDGTTVGFGTGGSYKSKGNDLVKAASAFATIPLDDRTSVDVSGALNKSVKNKTVQKNKYARGDKQKQIKLSLNKKIGGGGMSKGEEKLRRMKQKEKMKDL